MADRSRELTPSPARSRLLRRFARAQDGAAAVEFAFVAIPFLVLVFAIIELGLAFLVSMTLENALMNVDRTIRTGQLQTTGGTAASFRTAVCRQMVWMGSSSCQSSIILDVRSLPSFAATNALPAPKASKTCWDPGGPRSIILVRAYYRWPLITPLLQNAVGGAPGDRQINFAAVFANEPYSDTPAPSVTCP
uniref:TadE family protein n=1 Tax=Caulobacter sp. (strain K31) TaxID=366602 RepID=B0SYF5_CAUSK